MLVVGDREVEQRTVTLRTRGSKETQAFGLADASGVSRLTAGRCELRRWHGGCAAVA